MSKELELDKRRWRTQIPAKHKHSLDTRIAWLWQQKFGTIQTIWKESSDVLDHTACTLILQAIMAQDLPSIQLIYQRIEGGAITDQELADQQLAI